VWAAKSSYRNIGKFANGCGFGIDAGVQLQPQELEPGADGLRHYHHVQLLGINSRLST
jgi:hypothetical protein